MISVPILFCLIASVLAQSADQGSFPTPQSHKPHKTPFNHLPPKLYSSIKPSDPSSSNIKSSEPISSNIKPSSSNIKPPDPSSSSVETSDLSFPSNKPSPPTFSSIEPPKNTSSSHHNSKSPSSGLQPSKTSKCPFVRSLSYNLSAMCGEWYVYESSLNVRSKDERCIKVKLEEYPVGKFKLTSKSYITSISTISTVVTDVIVKNKGNGVLSSHVPLFGSIDKPVTLLTVERDYVILYSCEIHGAKRVESAWVFIKYASSPPIWLDDKVENAFLDHNLNMPNMNSSDYEKCFDVFSSYQFDPAPTPGSMIVSCFLNTTCLNEKWREFMTLLIPYRR